VADFIRQMFTGVPGRIVWSGLGMVVLLVCVCKSDCISCCDACVWVRMEDFFDLLIGKGFCSWRGGDDSFQLARLIVHWPRPYQPCLQWEETVLSWRILALPATHIPAGCVVVGIAGLCVWEYWLC
jgi:hypothetical protein